MGRKKKNNKNKNKGKPSPDETGASTSNTDEQGHINVEQPDVDTNSKQINDKASADNLDTSQEVVQEKQEVTSVSEEVNPTGGASVSAHQTGGQGRRSLRGDFEHQRQASLSSQGSVSSSLERELVKEIEGAIHGKPADHENNTQDNTPQSTVIPKLDLDFLEESGNSASLLSHKQLKSVEQITNEGLSYNDIKVLDVSSPKPDDQESGLGTTVTCSSTTNNAESNSNNVSSQNSDIVSVHDNNRPETQIQCHSDENIHSNDGSYGKDSKDEDSGNEYPVRPESRLMFNEKRMFNHPRSSEFINEGGSEISITGLPNEVGYQGHHGMIGPESSVEDNLHDFHNNSGDYAHNDMHGGANYYSDGISGEGTENITVSAYLSEPNIATYLRDNAAKSPNNGDDYSAESDRRQVMYSGNSSPRSFADLSALDGPSIEMVSGIHNQLQKPERPETPVSDTSRGRINEYDLDSSVDISSVVTPVTFSNQGTSLFDEIRTSEESLCEKEKLEKNIEAATKSVDVENYDGRHHEIDTGRSFISASSMKEDDMFSNPESHVHDHDNSKSHSEDYDNNKSLEESEQEGSVVERLPMYMQSAPALLEAQQLEENYREFMSSNSDISQEDGRHMKRNYSNIENSIRNDSEEKLTASNSSVYKICYDSHEQQAEHPGQGFVTEVVKNDLNAAFMIEENDDREHDNSADDDESAGNMTETSHNVEMMQNSQDIIQDREHVSQVLHNLNQEVETLRGENNHLYGEMTTYRNASKQYKGKAESMDGYIKKLRSDVKSLEIKLAEINSQRQNMKNMFTMTEQVLMLNTSAQIEALSYETYVQTELLTQNKGSQIGENIIDNQDFSANSSLSRPTKSVSPIRVQTEAKTDEMKKASTVKACAMLDKLIQQMSNIAETKPSPNERGLDANNSENCDDNDDVVENPEKWRLLAMAKISTDPFVIRLQRSLASATIEHDILGNKLKNKEKEFIEGKEELSMKLSDSVAVTEMAHEAKELWQMKYEGDHTEMKVLRDKVQQMEKNLMINQLEKERLEGEMEEVKLKLVKEAAANVAAEVESLEQSKKREAEKLEHRIGELETEKRRLEMDLENIQESHNKDKESVAELEIKLRESEEKKESLETEVKKIRDEYETLHIAVQSLEKAFLLTSSQQQPGTSTTNPAETLSLLAEARIEQLKHRVFETGTKSSKNIIRAKSTESLASSCGAASLHDDIIQQSELVLSVLRKSGELEEEEVVNKKEEIVNWEQVKNSIENQLNGNTEEGDKNTDEAAKSTNADGSDDLFKLDEAKTLTAEEENISSGTVGDNTQAVEDKEVKGHLSDLASAISADLGVKVNISIGEIKENGEKGQLKNVVAFPLDSSKLTESSDNRGKSYNKIAAEFKGNLKQKQKMELETMNRDYEKMRKKRLALLVQAYTGRDDPDKVLSRARTAWDDTESTSALKPQQNISSSSGVVENGDFSNTNSTWNDRRSKLDIGGKSLRNELNLERSTLFSADTDRYSSLGSSLQPFDKPLAVSALNRNSLLRQSQEELNNLLSNSSSSKFQNNKSGRLSHNTWTASTTESSTPYSYRLKREIYPHKKGYVPVGEFYDGPNEEEQNGRRDENQYDDQFNSNGYYDKGVGNSRSYYESSGYPPDDRRSSYAEYADSYYSEDPTFGGDDHYLPHSTIKKEAIIKMQAKLLKKKREAAKEKARRSGSPRFDYNEAFDSPREEESQPTLASKSWSAYDWRNKDTKTDLSSIKKTIHDYSTHLKTKYSGLNADEPLTGNKSNYYQDMLDRLSFDPVRDDINGGDDAVDDLSYESTKYASLYSASSKRDVLENGYSDDLQSENINFRGASTALEGDRYGVKSSLFDNVTHSSAYSNFTKPAASEPLYSSYSESNALSRSKPIDSLNSNKALYSVNSAANSHTGKLEEAKMVDSVTKTSPPYSSSYGLTGISSVGLTDKTTNPIYSSVYNTPTSVPNDLVSKASSSYSTSYSLSGSTVLSKPIDTIAKSSSSYSSPIYTSSGTTLLSSTKPIEKSVNTYSRDRTASPVPKSNAYSSDYTASRLRNLKKGEDNKLYKNTPYAEHRNTFTNVYSAGYDTNYTSGLGNSSKYSNSPISINTAEKSDTDLKHVYSANTSLSLDLNPSVNTNKSVANDIRPTSSNYDKKPENDFPINTKDSALHGSSRYENILKPDSDRYKGNLPMTDMGGRQKDEYGSSRYDYSHSVKNKSEVDKEIYLREMSQTMKKYGVEGEINQTLKKYGVEGYNAIGDKPLPASTPPASSQNKYNTIPDTVDNNYRSDTLREIVLRDYDEVEKQVNKEWERQKSSKKSSSRSKSKERLRDLNLDVVKDIDLSLSTKYDVGNETSDRAYDDDYLYSEKPTKDYGVPYTGSKQAERESNFYPNDITSKYDLNFKYDSSALPPDSQQGKMYGSYGLDTGVSATGSKNASDDIAYRSSSSSSHKKPSTVAVNDDVYKPSVPLDVRPKSPVGIHHRDDNAISSHQVISKNTKQQQQNYSPSAPLQQTNSKFYDSVATARPSSPKPELSREYLEKFNRSNANFDSHMFEMKQRSISITEDHRRPSPDDCSSVTGSSVSDADFIVVSSGDIVKRKSKTAKKLDKARNIELQSRTFSTPLEEDFQREELEERLQIDAGAAYSNTYNSHDTTPHIESSNMDDKWGEPRRHFGGLRENQQEDNKWKEPKVFTTKDMKSLGYVDTGANRISNKHQTDQRQNDDAEWYRESKGVENNEKSSKLTESDVRNHATPTSSSSKSIPPEKEPKKEENETKNNQTNYSADSEIERQKKNVRWHESQQQFADISTKSPSILQKYNSSDLNYKSSTHKYSKSLKSDSKLTEMLHKADEEEKDKQGIPKLIEWKKLIDTHALSGSKNLNPEYSALKPDPVENRKDMKLSDVNDNYKPIHLSTVTIDSEIIQTKNYESLNGNNRSEIYEKEITSTCVPERDIDYYVSELPKESSSKDKNVLLSHSAESIDASNNNSSSEDTFPADPYQRQELITTIIDKYTKDYDDSYHTQKSQNTFSKDNSLLSALSSRNDLDNSVNDDLNLTSSSLSSSVRQIIEELTPVKKSRIPVSSSRSASRSPALSRTSSSERGGSRTRIPVSRSLSWEKMEYLLLKTSPGNSRRGSTDTYDLNCSSLLKSPGSGSGSRQGSADRSYIPVSTSKKRTGSQDSYEERENMLNSSSFLSTPKSGKSPSRGLLRSPLKSDLTEEVAKDIDAIMKKYAMYSDEWMKSTESPQNTPQKSSSSKVQELVN